MKKDIEDLRKIVREEIFRGVPDFRFTQATEDYVDELKRIMIKYILTDKSNAQVEQKLALSTLNKLTQELNKEVLNLVKVKLEAIKGV